MSDSPLGETGPLTGVVVADFSRVLAAPLASMFLADLGATVIKVERPEGDDTRHWGPPWTETSSSYFEAANRNKLSVVLDLRTEEGQRAARALVDRSDVLLENFRDGTMERFGLGHETLSKTNPKLVYCSVTGFGSQDGASLPGYDFIVQAVGGLMSITGEPGGEPLKVGVALVDVLTGKDAAIGILAALRARDTTGLGQRIEVNLLSSLLASLANQASSFLASGTPGGPLGNKHPSIAPYETLRCRDGWLAVACGTDSQFRRLAASLDLPQLGDDPRFATNAARVENRAALIDQLESVMSSEDASTWHDRFAGVEVPAGIVGSISDAFALAADLGLDPTVDMGPDHPAQVRHPITYSGFVPPRPLPPPTLGEHTRQVLAWLTAGGAGDVPLPTKSQPSIDHSPSTGVTDRVRGH